MRKQNKVKRVQHDYIPILMIPQISALVKPITSVAYALSVAACDDDLVVVVHDAPVRNAVLLDLASNVDDVAARLVVIAAFPVLEMVVLVIVF